MLMKTGLGNWHPLFFLPMSHIWKIIIYMSRKRQEEKCFFVIYYFGGVSMC